MDLSCQEFIAGSGGWSFLNGFCLGPRYVSGYFFLGVLFALLFGALPTFWLAKFWGRRIARTPSFYSICAVSVGLSLLFACLNIFYLFVKHAVSRPEMPHLSMLGRAEVFVGTFLATVLIAPVLISYGVRQGVKTGAKAVAAKKSKAEIFD